MFSNNFLSGKQEYISIVTNVFTSESQTDNLQIEAAIWTIYNNYNTGVPDSVINHIIMKLLHTIS